jgi:hypothetical protein
MVSMDVFWMGERREVLKVRLGCEWGSSEWEESREDGEESREDGEESREDREE